jgi:hypothetical protein
MGETKAYSLSDQSRGIDPSSSQQREKQGSGERKEAKWKMKLIPRKMT